MDDVVAQAGGTTVKDPVYFIGGPMMGRIGKGSDPVTKTTNAILVLPKDHLIVQKKMRTSAIDLKRAASICCQCNTCTDLCPRNNLGHPIDPARFMRAASNQISEMLIHTSMQASAAPVAFVRCMHVLRALLQEHFLQT